MKLDSVHGQELRVRGTRFGHSPVTSMWPSCECDEGRSPYWPWVASGASTLRTAGLVVSGAVAVHELRYLAAGSATDAGAGHGYVPVAGLLSTVLLGLACGQLAAVVERARRTGSPGRRSGARTQAGFLAGWLLATFALALIFVAQELLEGALAGGREAGLGAVVAGGGWMALPISAAVGALLALALVGARRAVEAAVRGARRAAPRRRSLRRARLASGHRPAGAPLARHLAGRAPPCVVS